MDANFQTPRAYVQHFPPCGGVAGSPSPPLSVCSEPILQFPMPDGGSGIPGVQLKTPRIQLLNKTMGDACKKKNPRGHNLTPRIEPPDMMNFFQPGLPFPDYLSDSGDGGMISGREWPQFRFNPTPYQFPQPKSNTFQHPKLDAQFHYPQSELNMQIPCFQMEGWWNQPMHQQPELANVRQVSSGWVHPASLRQIPYPPSRNIKKQPQRVTNPNNYVRTKPVSNENDSKAKRKPAPARQKKRMITTIKTSEIKKERTKHNVLQRKQRKQVQQKNKSLHKTELCTHWSLTSKCTYKGKCYFAHGIEELKKRARLSNFKTRPCVDCPPENGRCLFGSRCNYCHPGEAIRRAVGSMYFDIDYYRALRKEFKDNEYPFGIFI